MAVIADNLGIYIPILGFPCCKESSFLSGSDVKEIGLPCRRHVFSPCVRKIPWRREWLPTPVCLPGKFHGQRSLAGYSSWSCKKLDSTERPTHKESSRDKYTIHLILPLPMFSSHIMHSSLTPNYQLIYLYVHIIIFSRWLSSKESACNAGDTVSIPGLRRSPREENGNPLQYACLENSMNRGTWGATLHRVTKS